MERLGGWWWWWGWVAWRRAEAREGAVLVDFVGWVGGRGPVVAACGGRDGGSTSAWRNVIELIASFGRFPLQILCWRFCFARRSAVGEMSTPITSSAGGLSFCLSSLDDGRFFSLCQSLLLSIS